MYRIGEFSKLCRIPVRTLRFYDEQGLLEPDRIDPFTAYRYYSASKLANCEAILVLKELGLGLEEIRRFLHSPERPDIAGLIEIKLRKLSCDMARLERLKSRITEDGKVYSITVRKATPFRVSAVREVFADRAAALSRLAQLRKSLGSSAGKRNIIINYETEYSETQLDMLIGVETVGNGARSDAGVKDIAFTQDTACIICGTQDIENAYRSLYRYAEEKGYQIIGAFHEVYSGDAVEIILPVHKLVDIEEHRDDDIDLPFENDERMLGRWEYYDTLPSREHFSPDKRKCTGEPWLKEIYCLSGGQDYWVLGWSKGYITTQSGYPVFKYRHSCEIEERDGQRYMFVYMKTYEYESRGGLPVVWVFKQSYSGEVKREDIRVRDNTDFPYRPDASVLGQWTVCDLVENVEQFSPDKQYFPKVALFFNSVSFCEGGKCVTCYGTDTKKQYECDWTKDIILHKQQELAEHYELKSLGEREYLFVEWKNGDYQFGGRRPRYYVFNRALG